MMKRRRRKSLKEQAISSSKPKGLPSPAELAAKINAAGMSSTEVMSWLGAVLSKAGMGSPAGPADEPSAEMPAPPLPEPTPEAVQERFENRLLNNLLGDIQRDFRPTKAARKKR